MYKTLGKIFIKLSKDNLAIFNKYIELFLDYNSKINLISNNDAKYLYEKHIFDSLAFNLFYKKYCKDTQIKLLDIGTGGGFPSVPIAINYKNIDVTAVDSINKKINFIKKAASELELNNLHPICSRVEDLNTKMLGSFDIVTSRAMARLNVILEYAVPFLKNGGYFVAYKSIKTEEEIESAQNALKVLKAEIINRIEYTLPIEEEHKRFLIIVKKISSTDKRFPRRNGLVVKNPL